MNYYAVLFLLRPLYLLRCEPLFEGQNACKTEENCVSTGGLAIVNHCVIVNLLRIVNSQWRSIFSTAGCFGYCSFLDFHSLSKEHQVSLLRTRIHFSHPELDGKSSEVGVGGRIGILTFPRCSAISCSIFAKYPFRILMGYRTFGGVEGVHVYHHDEFDLSFSRALPARI